MYEIVNPTKVIFGVDSLDILGGKAAELGTKALVITGTRFAEKAGLTNKVKIMLRRSNLKYAIFNRIEPQPDISLIEAGADFLKENKCDLVIAVGGGSVIDSGKSMALLATNKGACTDFLDGEKITNDPLPLIAIPTTAGTGSEVTRYLVFSDKKTKKKFTIKSEKVCPRLAIVDPRLTLSLTKRLTAATAIDSLVHFIEGYLNTKSNPYVKPLSLSGIKTIVTKLNALIENPTHIQLREDIMFAATLSGIVINNARTGIIHTMSTAIEPHCNLYHGEVVGRLLPKILSFYVDQGRSKQELIELFAYVYGERSDNPKLFVQKTKEFIMSLFDRDNFEDQNITASMIDGFVDRVFMDKGLPGVSPVSINSEDLRKLFNAALYT